MAQSGVFSLGFQTHTSPQTQAKHAFQLHTATGKLNADIIPTIPNGWYCSYMRWPGLSLCMVKSVQLAAKANSKIADVYHFLYFAQAFLQAFAHFITHQLPKVMFIFS